jgi:hypothetical protein
MMITNERAAQTWTVLALAAYNRQVLAYLTFGAPGRDIRRRSHDRGLPWTGSRTVATFLK